MKGLNDLQDDISTLQLYVADQGPSVRCPQSRALDALHRLDQFRQMLENTDPEPTPVTGAVCPRCGGDGEQLSEVALSGTCRCGTCRGSGRVPDDGSASPWVNERLAEKGLLQEPR